MHWLKQSNNFTNILREGLIYNKSFSVSILKAVVLGGVLSISMIRNKLNPKFKLIIITRQYFIFYLKRKNVFQQKLLRRRRVLIK